MYSIQYAEDGTPRLVSDDGFVRGQDLTRLGIGMGEEGNISLPRGVTGDVINNPNALMNLWEAQRPSIWSGVAGDTYGGKIGGTTGLVAPGWMPSDLSPGTVIDPSVLFSDAKSLVEGVDLSSIRKQGFTDSEMAARNAFLAANPGYAQVTSSHMADGTFKTAGPSAGNYIIDPSQVKYDPTYGYITPTSNFGYAGGKGGFRDALTPLAMMALMATGASFMTGAEGAAAGAGAEGAAAGGWTSGFDLPMGGDWGISNLGAATPGYTSAASAAADTLPTLGSEFSLVGGTAGNPAGGLYSGATSSGLNASSAGLGFTPSAAITSGTSGALLTPSIAAAGGFPLASGLTAAQTAGGIASGLSNAAQAGSALSRLLDGNASNADKLSLLGNLAGTGLGLLGANQQSNAMGNIAQQYLDMGAPYRSLLQQSYAPGFSMANQPDFKNALDVGAQAAARATSAKVGNPVDNPGAYAEMQKYISGSLALPQLNTYRSQLGTFGQMGTNQAGTAQMGQAQAQGGMYDALGYGLGQLTQPDNPFKGLLDQIKPRVNTGWSF